MKAKVVTRVSIGATADEVFKYLTDLKYMHLWNPQLKAASSQKVLRLNSTYQTVSIVLGITIEALNMVTEYVPGKLLQVENTTGNIHYLVNFRLTRKNRATTMLTCTTTVWSESLAFAFSTPVLKLLARRELQTDLQALKIAVENQLSARPLS